MNAGLKTPGLTLQAGSIHQPRFLVVGYPDTGKPVSLTARLLPAGISSLRHLPFPPPAGLNPKRRSLSALGNKDTASALASRNDENQPVPRKVVARRAGMSLPAVPLHHNSSCATPGKPGRMPAPPLLQTRGDLGGGKEFGWLSFTTQRKGEQGCLPGRTPK